MISRSLLANQHLVPRRLQIGVNLIEVMVAMAIGLFLVLGATTLYVNTRQTANVDDSIARLQENARYALSIIETDVRMANYWGLRKDGSTVVGKESGAADNRSSSFTAGAIHTCGDAFNDPEVYVEATNNNYSFDCPANSTAVVSADTLVVRRAATATTAADATRLQICSTRSEARQTIGANAMCGTGAEYHNQIVHGYYVDQESSQSNDYPALRRWTLVGGPAYSDVEILPGIEDMQIEIGWDNHESVDTDAPAVVRYVQPDNAILKKPSGFPNGRIVAVRVWLLVRAESPESSFTDARTYVYGDRAVSNGTVNNLNGSGAAGAAYAPNDKYRRLLVSRTFYVRNVSGSN